MKTIVLMIFLFFSSMAAVKASPCLPEDVQSALSSRFSGWKLVELKDLRDDDQNLLRERPNADCPGVAVGDFERSGRKSYAVTLFKDEGGLRQLLLVYDSKVGDAKKRMVVLDGPRAVAYLSVVWKIEPGESSDVDGKKLMIKADSIMYEAIEAGSMLFFFSKGGYRHVQLAE